MKISQYEKLKGRQAILEECNYDLKDIRQHLIRECNLPRGYDLSKVMKEYKNLLDNMLQPTRKSELIAEFLEKAGGNNDN